MKIALAWIGLIRPLNFLLFLAGVATGGILASTPSLAISSPGLWIAMLSASLIGGGANAANDYFDVEIDQINRPDRPIPAGLVSKKTALSISLVLSIAGLSLAASLSLTHLSLALIATGLLYLYNSRLKKLGLIGNLAVSLVVGVSLLYGGASMGSMLAAISGFIFAFLITLAREIIKDIEDIEGDKRQAAESLALRIGENKSSQIAQFILVGLVFIAPFPFVFLSYGGWFMALVAILCVSIIATIVQLNAQRSNKTTYSLASHRLKATMMVGIAALCLSSF